MKINLCANCGFPADSKLDEETSYYSINYNVYCSLNCFYEKYKENEKKPVAKVSTKKKRKKK